MPFSIVNVQTEFLLFVFLDLSNILQLRYYPRLITKWLYGIIFIHTYQAPSFEAISRIEGQIVSGHRADCKEHIP